MIIISEITQFNDIPLNLLYKKDAKKSPAILLFHGLNNDRHECIELAHRLVECGFSCACIDAHKHGDRISEELLRCPFPEIIKQMYSVIEKSKEEFPFLLQELEKRPEFNTDKTGIGGISMGGLLCFALIASYPQLIQSCVSFIGLPHFYQDWLDMLELTGEADRLRDPDFEQKLKALDPVDKISSTYAPKPLLMINGAKDKNVPPHYCKALYETLTPYYKTQPESLGFETYQVDHRVIREMLVSAVSFYKTSLLK
jgi:predicted esterase